MVSGNTAYSVPSGPTARPGSGGTRKVPAKRVLPVSVPQVSMREWMVRVTNELPPFELRLRLKLWPLELQ